MSGRVESSRMKFGEVAVICPNPKRSAARLFRERRDARLLSLNVESAALPERLGIVAIDLLTIREGKALAIYSAMKRSNDRERSKKYFSLNPVFHRRDGAPRFPISLDPVRHPGRMLLLQKVRPVVMSEANTG
jgi:hypothetical protein